jgi:hypothetical protein
MHLRAFCGLLGGAGEVQLPDAEATHRAVGAQGPPWQRTTLAQAEAAGHCLTWRDMA